MTSHAFQENSKLEDTPSLTGNISPRSQHCATDLEQESLLPILGNRSLPPSRLHEKKSLAVVRYLPTDMGEKKVNRPAQPLIS